MIATTKRIVRKFGLSDRFSYIEGDVLKADFGSGYDVATLGHILHSEGAERSRKLLKKTFNALKSGGTIAIGEWLVNDERTEPLAGLMFAINMLVHSEQGDTFSFNEIKSWLEEAGFKNARTVSWVTSLISLTPATRVNVRRIIAPFLSAARRALHGHVLFDDLSERHASPLRSKAATSRRP